jgi:RNA-binding protein YhbY
MKHLLFFAILLLLSLGQSFLTIRSLSFHQRTKVSTIFIAKPSIFRTKVKTVNKPAKSIKFSGSVLKAPLKQHTIKEDVAASYDDNDEDDDDHDEDDDDGDNYEGVEYPKVLEKDNRKSRSVEKSLSTTKKGVQDFSSYPLTKTNDGNYWINEEYGSNQTERGMIWNRHKHLLIVGEKGVTSTLVNGALHQIKYHNYVKVRVSYYDLNSTDVSFQFLNNASLPESVQLKELADVYEVRHQGFMLIRKQFLLPKVWIPRNRSTKTGDSKKLRGKPRKRAPGSSQKTEPFRSATSYKKKFPFRGPRGNAESYRDSPSPRNRKGGLSRTKTMSDKRIVKRK